jgi:hypothetical protein
VCVCVCVCLCVCFFYAVRRGAALQMTSIQSDEVIAIVPFLRDLFSTPLARASHHRPTARPARKCRALAMFTNVYALSLTLPCAFASVCMCVRVRVVYVMGCVRRL